MENDNKFVEKIDQLCQGDIDHIDIDKDEFLSFREVWVQHPCKEHIIGYAQCQGKVTYRYEKHHDENN